MDDDSRRLETTLEVITLMHGGGPVAGEGDHPQRPTRKPDPISPIRGTEVKGHLRFWWRATHGCTKASVAEMREAEDELWGNASKPNDPKVSKVDVTIKQRSATKSVEVATLPGPNGRPEGIGQGLRYGAFATANLSEVPGTATLTLRVAPNARLDEVQDALHAWLLFGGIGGRTRRGFGAVFARGVPDASEFLGRFNTANTIAMVPTLHGATLVLGDSAHATAARAHRAAVDAVRYFRQERGFARNQGVERERPGRSRWPEPDALRRLFNRSARGHEPAHTVRAFPRAAFGMPIVFQFKDRDDPGGTLTPNAKGGRMASPVIVRPCPVGSQWKAMALRLRVPGLEERLTSVYVGDSQQRGLLRDPEHTQIYPLKGYGPDVLSAFLEFFKSFPRP